MTRQLNIFHVCATREDFSESHVAVRKILFIKILFENDPQHRREQINFEKKRQTLNGRLPFEDGSVFDDSVCVLIVMT